MENLVKNTKFASAVLPAAGVAAATDIEGSIIDMTGFNAIAALVRMGAITATAVTSLKWQQGDESDLSDASDLEGTQIDVAVADANELFVLDLIKPTKRYVRLYVDRLTANAVVATAEYLIYQAMKAPITQAAGINVETHSSPAEGTA